VFAEGGDLSTETILRTLSDEVPLSRTMEEEIDSLRKWAYDRARPASIPKDKAAAFGRQIEL
jgi:hypothetical protein